MRFQDQRFYVPATTEEEFALARARVRERGEGLKVSTALFGGSALVGAVFAVAAHLSGGAAPLVLPAVVVLIVLPGAALAIVGASSLIWRSRLRRLTRSSASQIPRVAPVPRNVAPEAVAHRPRRSAIPS
jgi:hypothetical protein